MATVREMRVNAARGVMLDPRFDGVIGLSYSQADLLADYIVDALFPDRTFNNMEVGDV